MNDSSYISVEHIKPSRHNLFDLSTNRTSKGMEEGLDKAVNQSTSQPVKQSYSHTFMQSCSRTVIHVYIQTLFLQASAFACVDNFADATVPDGDRQLRRLLRDRMRGGRDLPPGQGQDSSSLLGSNSGYSYAIHH